MILLPVTHHEQMRFIETKAAETELLVSVDMQLIEQAGCGALRCRGRIVHLMREIAGELAECVELFGLLLQAGDFAHAVEQDGDAALRHRGNGSQHLREDGLWKVESPCVGNDIAVAAVGLHAREGQEPGDLSGAADKECQRGRRRSRRT